MTQLPPDATASDAPTGAGSGGAGRRRTPLPGGFGVIWTTVALDLIGFGIVIPILPRWAEQFGASPLVAGLVIAAYSLAQAVFSPLLGSWSDRIGRRPVLILSLAGTAVGSVLTGLAPALWVVFVARLLDGASGASVAVAHAAVADTAPPDQRARLMGMLGAAFGIGFVAGPAIGGLMALIDVRAPFLAAGAVAAVNALVALKRLPETHPRLTGRAPAGAVAGDRVGPGEAAGTANTPAPAAVSEAAGLGLVTRLVIVAFVSVTAFSGFESTFSLLLDRRFSLSTSAIYGVFAVLGLVLSAVQGGAVGPVVARLGEMGALRTGLVLNAVGLGVLAFATSWPVMAVALLLLVSGQGTVTPSLSSAVAAAGGDGHGRALGRQQSAGAVARIVGPVLGGALFGRVATGAPYVAGAALLLLALAAVPVRRTTTEVATSPAI